MDEGDVLEGVGHPKAEVADHRAMDEEDREERCGRGEEEQTWRPRVDLRPHLVTEPAPEDHRPERGRPAEESPGDRTLEDRPEHAQEAGRVRVAREGLRAEDQDERGDQEHRRPEQGEVPLAVGAHLETSSTLAAVDPKDPVALHHRVPDVPGADGHEHDHPRRDAGDELRATESTHEADDPEDEEGRNNKFTRSARKCSSVPVDENEGVVAVDVGDREGHHRRQRQRRGRHRPCLPVQTEAVDHPEVEGHPAESQAAQIPPRGAKPGARRMCRRRGGTHRRS